MDDDKFLTRGEEVGGAFEVSILIITDWIERTPNKIDVKTINWTRGGFVKIEIIIVHWFGVN